MLTELSVPHSVRPSRTILRSEFVELRTVAESGARRAMIHLKQRQQDIRVEHETFVSCTVGDRSAFVRLITNAIREVASLTTRRSTLIVSMNDNHILIKGKNALDLPTSYLAIDRKIVAQASRLGIVPRLIWDQGCGPHLRCALPCPSAGLF